MDVRASLLKFYFNVESVYYEFLDAVDEHLPVYDYLVNPVENRGYPSFPVYTVVIAALVALLFFFSLSVPATSSLQLQVEASGGAPLPGAVITVSVPKGDALVAVASGTTDVAGKIGFVGVPVEKLRIRIQKSGYDVGQLALDKFPEERVLISLNPNTDTVARLGQDRQVVEEVKKQLEELKQRGFPEFAEALEPEQQAQEGDN